jgi:hypothetical protein
MRILSNQGLPDLRKAESIVRVLNHRLAVIPVEAPQQSIGRLCSRASRPSSLTTP